MAASPRLAALAVSALAERDRALAALDGGNAAQAAAVARGALGILESAGHPQLVIAAQCHEALAARS
jgi:hypothetical protein